MIVHEYEGLIASCSGGTAAEASGGIERGDSEVVADQRGERQREKS